jgi:hypothetical protein
MTRGGQDDDAFSITAPVPTQDPKALQEYLSIDPDLQEDGLPRPYRLISQMVKQVLEEVGEEIHVIESRKRSVEFEYHVKQAPEPMVTRLPDDEPVICSGQDKVNPETLFLGFASGTLRAIQLGNNLGSVSEFTPFPLEPKEDAGEEEEPSPTAEPVRGVAASSRACYIPFDLKPSPRPPPTSVLIWSESSAGTFVFERKSNVGRLEKLCNIQVPMPEVNEDEDPPTILSGSILGAEGLNWVVLLTDKVYVYACPLPKPPHEEEREMPLSERVIEEVDEENEDEAQEALEPEKFEPFEISVPLFAIDFYSVGAPLVSLLEVFSTSTSLLLQHPESSMLMLYELLPSALQWPSSRPEELQLDDMLALPACSPGTVTQPSETAATTCRREWDLPSYPTTIARQQDCACSRSVAMMARSSSFHRRR